MEAKWFDLRNRGVRRISAGLCLLLFVVLQVFASSGPLHRFIHRDADSPDHHCAVTLVAHGQVDSPAALPVVVAFTSGLIFCLTPVKSQAASSFDYRLSPSRAPPLV